MDKLVYAMTIEHTVSDESLSTGWCIMGNLYRRTLQLTLVVGVVAATAWAKLPSPGQEQSPYTSVNQGIYAASQMGLNPYSTMQDRYTPFSAPASSFAVDQTAATPNRQRVRTVIDAFRSTPGSLWRKLWASTKVLLIEPFGERALMVAIATMNRIQVPDFRMLSPSMPTLRGAGVFNQGCAVPGHPSQGGFQPLDPRIFDGGASPR